MAGEAQQIQTSVYMPGKNSGGHVKRQLTFEIISDWIRIQGFDEYTTEGLIELASRYPTQALPSFRKNFNLMIQRVRQKRKEELDQPMDDRPAGELPLGEDPVVEEVVEQEDWEKENLDESQSPIGGEAPEQHTDDEAPALGSDGFVEHA